MSGGTIKKISQLDAVPSVAQADVIPIVHSGVTYKVTSEALADFVQGEIGLGTSAYLNVGTTTGTVAAGDDSRIVGAAQKASNLSDLSDAAQSRTNLGLGSIATQSAASVAITGGSITGIADLAIADGGTGASDAATARTNLAVVGTAELAASTGAALVGAIQSGTGATARTVQAKLRDVVSVKDFGATGDGVTNDLAAIQAALTAVGALADGGEVVCPPGVYVLGATTLTVPQKATLVLAAGAKLTSTATNAITVTLGSDGISGGVRGAGMSSIISHTGTGAGVYAEGAFSQADLRLADFRVLGSSAGAAGIHLEGFNMAELRSVKASGYSAGDGFRSTGANCVNGYNCEFTSNLNGVHNLTKPSYSANAVHFYGGQIKSNTGWGWFEDSTGGGGRNLSNGPRGVVFEANGTNASATTGDIWNDNCDSFVVDGNYFENGSGIVPTNCITIGSASNGPKGTAVVNNLFTNTNTNTVNDVNGQSVFVQGNVQNGANTNFLQHGAAARGLFLGVNRVASTNYFAGSDNGVDSVILGGASVGVNQSGPTTTGYGYVTLTGYGADLIIRTRSGGSNATVWQAIDGTGIAQMSNGGALNIVGHYEVDSVKVVGNQGAAVADATDAASAITQLNALLARLRAHGLIAT